MIFPFLTVALGPNPSPAALRPRPIMPLRVYHRSVVAMTPVLVDTGADEVLLPDHLMPLLGFTPGSGRTRSLTAVAGRATFQYFDVELELVARPNDRVRWRTAVGFGPVPPRIGLFGVAGGLEFFHLSMSVVDGWFALGPHPLVGVLPPTFPHTPYPIP